jgi:hypothetical protein
MGWKRESGMGNRQCVVGRCVIAGEPGNERRTVGFPACRRRTAPLAERDALSVEGEWGIGSA